MENPENGKSFVSTLITDDLSYYFWHQNAIQLYKQAEKFFLDEQFKKAYQAYKKMLDEHKPIKSKMRKDEDHRMRGNCYYKMAYIRRKLQDRDTTQTIKYYAHALVTLIKIAAIEKKDVDSVMLVYEGLKENESNESKLTQGHRQILDFYSLVFSGSDLASVETYHSLSTISSSAKKNNLPNEHSLIWWLMSATWKEKNRNTLATSVFQKWLMENEQIFKKDMSKFEKAYKNREKQSTPLSSPRGILSAFALAGGSRSTRSFSVPPEKSPRSEGSPLQQSPRNEGGPFLKSPRNAASPLVKVGSFRDFFSYKKKKEEENVTEQKNKAGEKEGEGALGPAKPPNNFS
jgi:hypothetical protein